VEPGEVAELAPHLVEQAFERVHLEQALVFVVPVVAGRGRARLGAERSVDRELDVPVWMKIRSASRMSALPASVSATKT